MPAAVGQLVTLTHALGVAQIDNSDATPRLVKYCDSERCYLTGADDCWEQIEQRFRSQPHSRAASMCAPAPVSDRDYLQQVLPSVERAFAASMRALASERPEDAVGFVGRQMVEHASTGRAEGS